MRTLILSLIVVATLCSACKNRKLDAQEQLDNLYRFREYITDATQGVISNRSDIKIVLRKPVEGWAANQGLSSQLLTLSPSVKGKVVALNNQTIAFIPEKPLEQDTEYKISLKLGSILNNLPRDFRKFELSVKTSKQQFSVLADKLQSYSKEWQYVNGTLHTADVLEQQIASKLITATQNGKKLSVAFESSLSEGTQFPFRIDSIQRYAEDSYVEVSWDGAPYKIDSKGSEKIFIPGKNNFTIIDITVSEGPQPFLEISFSDPLMKNQQFDGLVAIQGAQELTFLAEGNVLKAYPRNEVKGSAVAEVFQGIQSAEGNKLKKNFSETVVFEQLKPEVRLLSNGTLLPSSTNLKVNFEAVNLRNIDVTVTKIYQDNILQFLQFNELNGNQYLRNVARPIARKTISLQNSLQPDNSRNFRAYSVDLRKLITPEPGAIYRVTFDFKPSYSTYPCESTNFKEEEATEENFDNDKEASMWDAAENYYYDEYDYDYDWYERDNPCNSSYYRSRQVAVNILATDLGVTVKKNATGNYFVSVNSLVTTQPVAGAKVTFYNFQQQPLGSLSTDGDGFARFHSDKIAYFAIAEKDNQRTYLKINDGNALSVSKFDVSGVQLQKGIKGYLYGERGVWRPGDTLFLSFMLNDKVNDLPASHPVKLELSDPYGKITHREVQTTSLNNLYRFTVVTDENAPTGNWNAKVSVGGASFTERIRIETIKPNRLKIKTSFNSEILSGEQDAQGKIEVSWLHGAIAKGLKAGITARFSPKTTTFAKYPGYVFDDPSRLISSEDQVVFDGTIDEAGQAIFNVKPQFSEKAPGMLQAAIMTKVYENGGDFSSDVLLKTYSPYQTYLGLNVPKGDNTRGMLLTDTKHRFEVVSLNEKGNPKPADNLQVTIHKIGWRWWWETSAENLSSYASGSYYEKVFEQTLSTDDNGKASFEFELKYPEWGRYLVRVEDSQSGHATGKVVYIDWPGWAGKSMKNDPSAATMLLFSTDKPAYKVGDKAIVTFPSGEAGRALVTIENGSEILDALWITPKKGETKFEIPITQRYTPNVYIHISLLQPHAYTANDLPIRLYGVMPISVENPATKLEPKLTLPEVLKPEETVTLKVSEKSGKPMTYTLAMVDEGLLDLTRFETPNPWNSFYAREALGIKTWDVYDNVIGAYGGRIDQVFSIGGAEAAAGAKNKKANRFKPMVIYAGPFSLKKGETKAHQIKIPKYVGSVRTMVVAENPDTEAYGSAEKTTPVRKPLMVLASLPRKISPGEKVILPVTVFAMENKIKDVTINLKGNAAYKIIGANSQSLEFSQPDEKMVYFELEVTDREGIANLAIEASGNGEKASYQVEMQVMNPNPIATTVQKIALEAGSSKTIEVETFGVSGSNKAQIEFSSLPPVNFSGRMSYLIQYPHGCVEQVTSGAFPQLYMGDVFDLTTDKAKESKMYVETAIKKLAAFQMPNGGFSYWQGQNYANDWGSSYAGHFLLEAEKKGYVLPIGFKNSWVVYQKQAARQWRKNPTNSDFAQAYRLYTLALAGQPDVSSMNRLRETANISTETKHRLAAAYALIGQKKAAWELYKSAAKAIQPLQYDYYTYGSTERNQAMSLETLVILGDKNRAQEAAKTLANMLNENRWMSTQTTAYGLMAMAKFAQLIGGKSISVSFSANGKQEALNSEKSLAVRPLSIQKGANRVLLKNNGNNTVFVQVAVSGLLPVGDEKPEQSGFSATVSYKGRDGKTLSVNSLPQGTDFVAEVTLTNQTNETVKNVALTQILPSGWEIVNTRFTDFGEFAANTVTHTDLRDDRAYFYFDINPKESKTLRILLSASYAGTYYMPGVYGEAMYNNNFRVHTKGQWIAVVR